MEVDGSRAQDQEKKRQSLHLLLYEALITILTKTKQNFQRNGSLADLLNRCFLRRHGSPIVKRAQLILAELSKLDMMAQALVEAAQ